MVPRIPDMELIKATITFSGKVSYFFGGRKPEISVRGLKAMEFLMLTGGTPKAVKTLTFFQYACLSQLPDLKPVCRFFIISILIFSLTIYLSIIY
jgi:hypothetical protein